MANASIFIGGDVKRTTNLSELAFNHKSGFLIKFKFEDSIYTHTSKDSFRKEDQDKNEASGGYYKEAEFLKYLVKKISLSDLGNDKLPLIRLEKAQAGDTIVVRKLKIEAPYDRFCKANKITWDYILNSEIVESDLETIKIPLNATTTENDVPVNGIARSFYNRHIPLITSVNFTGDKDTGAYFITLISLQIHRINRDIFVLFNTPKFDTYIGIQNSEWNSEILFVNPTLEDLQNYYKSITDFYNSAFSNQLLIQSAPDDIKLYWLAFILSENGLRVVPVSEKLEVLKLIAKGIILGGISLLTPNEVNEEEFVIKIVISINDTQADEFLNGLTTYRSFEEQKIITLFQSFYDKVNDAGIGEENLKILMNELYSLWLKSSYFPYNANGTIKESLINPTNYVAKPIALNYQSGSFIFNYSNYDFTFSGNSINVTEEIFTTNGDVASTYTDAIGDYEIYQSITIQSTDSNTNNIKFLAINIEGNQRAVLPIFYLKYIDDKKETENQSTVLEVTFDLATSFLGISNVRHLRHINKLGRIALRLETAAPGTILLTIEFGQGVGGLIEISASLGDIFLNYYENYDGTYCNVNSSSYSAVKCDFYTDLSRIFLALQLLTGTGAVDYVAKRQLRTASRKILSKPIPDDLNAEALTLLRKLAGDIDQILLDFRDMLFDRYQTYNTPIWTRINNATSPGGMGIAKRNEFLEDFADAPVEVLDDLNADNGDLIDYWRRAVDLKDDRTKIIFLRSYKQLMVHPRLTTHVHVGHSGINGTGGAWVTGGHNKQLFLPDQNGVVRWRWVNINDVKTNTKGYSYGLVERNMSDKSWTGGNPPTPWKKKNDETGFWPYDTERINQEMALALSNKKFVRFESRPKRDVNIYRGMASDGQDVEIVIDANNPQDIISIYPVNI